MLCAEIYMPHRISVVFNRDVRVAEMAKFKFASDGIYAFNLKAVLSRVGPADIRQRTMLYLMVCDEAEYNYISERKGQYCFDGSYANETLCNSYPLDSTSNYASPAQQIEGKILNKFEGYQTFFFFIANCEILGGEKAILRSCTNDPGPNCFRCMSYNNESTNCEVSPHIYSDLKVDGSYSLCAHDGSGCGADSFRTLYCGVLFGWMFMMILWIGSIWRSKKCTIRLQISLLAVPISQVRTSCNNTIIIDQLKSFRFCFASF